MDCDNCLCIYNFKGKCILENTTINVYGMCDECIYPNIDEKTLEQAKLKLLTEFEE